MILQATDGATMIEFHGVALRLNLSNRACVIYFGPHAYHAGQIHTVIDIELLHGNYS